MNDIIKRMAQAVIDGEAEDARNLADLALEEGLDPLECITTGLTKGIQKAGELFSTGEYYLPELLIAAEAMKEALNVLEPKLISGQKRDVVGRVVLGTVEGDQHEIGKKLVATMLIANGFQVMDIGVNQSVDKFIEAAKEFNADIVGASALLTTTMVQQEKIIAALSNAGLRKRVKYIVGGAPLTPEYAKKNGADGYAADAISAVDLALHLIDSRE